MGKSRSLKKYISIETAKLLKEVGFNDEVSSYFHPMYGLYLNVRTPDDYNHERWAEGYYSAPTIGQLEEWFIQEHNVHFDKSFDMYTYDLTIVHFLYPKNVSDKCNVSTTLELPRIGEIGFTNSHSEVMDRAFRKALEIIKQHKNGKEEGEE